MSICILRNFRILQFSMHKFRILQGNLFRKLQIITLIFRKIQEKLFRLEFRKVQISAKYNKPNYGDADFSTFGFVVTTRLE